MRKNEQKTSKKLFKKIDNRKMSRSHKSSDRSSSYDRTKKVQEVEDEELANLNDRLLEKGTTVVRDLLNGEPLSPNSDSLDREFHIKEIDLRNLEPVSKDSNDGVKYIFMGKCKSGKSQLIKAVMMNKNFIPCCQVYSGTEDSNKSFSENVPALNIYNGLSNPDIKRFIHRQKLAIRHLDNPWGLLVIDDCFDKPSQFREPLWLSIFKNSRHWKLLTLIALQWCLDLLPSERSLVDYSFIFAEPSETVRKRLWMNFGSVVGTFPDFCDIMTQGTENYTAIVFKNLESSNKLEDRIGWYRANINLVNSDWRFGHPLLWQFSQDRFNTSYEDPLI
jgi:hypothetical protein